MNIIDTSKIEITDLPSQNSDWEGIQLFAETYDPYIEHPFQACVSDYQEITFTEDKIENISNIRSYIYSVSKSNDSVSDKIKHITTAIQAIKKQLKP